MEALAAVGLASNVVQFISFTRELVTTSKQISRSADGALIQNLEIEAIARNLQSLSDSLIIRPRREDGDSSTYYEPPKEEESLQQLCRGCRYVARLLIEKMKGLQVDSKVSGRASRKWASFRQALNSVLAENDIDDLETRLDRYQTTINTTLLASLRSQINKAEKNRVTRDDTMSHHLLGFIDDAKAWQANLIDTLHRNKWQPDKVHDVELFSLQLESGAQIDKETLSQQRIHSLLRFEEIADRHETIAEAHRKTYEWVFHEGRPQIYTSRHSSTINEPESPPQWDNFLKWLQGGGSMYWITGKPGSGKSTLMKFLFNEERTLQAATNWSGETSLITAGFFFWNSGTSMQMSRMGLLQTLLYQCLRGRLNLIPSLFPARWSRHTLIGGDVRPWSWLELVTALKTLVSMQRFSFLIFIDGLDEFDGDPQDLVSLILDLKKMAPQNVKLCVASRPWLVFEESLREMPWLRMEDLTRQDIQLYIDENMCESPSWNELQRFMPDEASKMIDEITDKAVGVFLWVILVVSSLLSGLRDGDNIEDLWKRINELPSALEDLFRKILSDLNPRYSTQACEMFQLAFTAFDPLTLLAISFALDGPTVAIKAQPCQMLSEGELRFRGDTMRRRVISRSKGLLEVRSVATLGERAKVEYLHRTVRDFFKSEQSWTYIKSGAPGFDALLRLSASFLRQVKMVQRRDKAAIWDEFWRCFTYAVEYIRTRDEPGREGVDTKASIQILDALSQAGDAFWGQPPLRFGPYNTWLEELVDCSTTRTMDSNWTAIYAQSQPEKKTMPHWTNTLYLADLRPIHPPHDLVHELRGNLLSSFFDFVLVLQYNAYISSKMTPEIARHTKFAGESLLVQAVTTGNFSLAHQILELGADPNVKQRTRSRTVWERFLQYSRSGIGDPVLYSALAVTFVRHGADMSQIRPEDIDTIFAELDPDEKDALMLEVTKLKRPQKAESKPVDASSSSTSIRKAVKAKFRKSSFFKKKNMK